MHLGMPREQRGDERVADVAADAPRERVEARGIGCILRGDRAERYRRHRDEHEGHAGAHDEQDRHEGLGPRGERKL